MKKLLLSFSLIVCGLVSTAHSYQMPWHQGQVEVSLNQYTGWYYSGSTLSHNFGTRTYIERILISAEGSQSFAKASVYADGELISVMGVPGRDPEYPMLVRKAISSLVIKFEGSVRIKDLRVFGSGFESRFGEGSQFSRSQFLGDVETPAGVANLVLSTVAALQETASDADFRLYLLPLRKSALRLAAKGGGRPFLSSNTQAQAKDLIAKISASESFLDRLSDRDYFSAAVADLLFAKEKLQAVYEIQ